MGASNSPLVFLFLRLLIMSRFLYDAARIRAEDAGIVVVSCCYADLPKGLPRTDHYGNHLTAQTIYIGQPGTMEKNALTVVLFTLFTKSLGLLWLTL